MDNRAVRKQDQGRIQQDLRKVCQKSNPALLSLIWGSSLTILLVRDLGIIKYIKDEDDADLHADLSLYDALG
jgi:hypothetical protein